MLLHELFEDAPRLSMKPDDRLARAEAMGFNTSKVWYHGTMRKSFKAFRPGKDGIDELGTGVYFTASEGTAGMWGRPAIGGRVLACFIKRGKFFDFTHLNPNMKQGPERYRTEALTALHAAHSGYMDHRFGPNSSYDYKDFVALVARRGPQALNTMLSHAGYIGAIDTASQIPDQVVVFDPVNIRAIKARFDPAKADSPNIMD